MRVFKPQNAHFATTSWLSQISFLEKQKEIQHKELGFKKTELERNKLLYDRGVIASREYEQKQLEYLQAEKSFQNTKISISQLKENIINSNKNIRGTEIDKVNEELVLLKGVLQSFNQLKRAIKNWEIQYAFISTIEGKVSYIEAWSENQDVNSGDLLFTIVPKGENEYLARLKTPIQNSGKIEIGQKVLIQLENYPKEEFGMLIGEVSNVSVSPDSKGFYSVQVSLPEKLITSYKFEIKFTQELHGNAEIVTEDLRLIERFFYQIRNIFNS